MICELLKCAYLEINPEYTLEGLMLKLKFQSLGYLMQRPNSLGKILLVGKIEGRRRGWQRMRMVGWHHQFSGSEIEQTPETVKGMEAWHAAVHWGAESDMI